MRKIGVVIQGQVNSSGFNASEYINSNARKLLDTGKVTRVILSTWEDENTENISTEILIIKNRKITGEDLKNRLKQTYSTLAGIDYLIENNSCDLILKIRTDQLVNPEIINYTEELCQPVTFQNGLLSHTLLFSYVNRSIPFHIGDFFFAGEKNDMRKFLKANTEYGSFYFQEAVEVDLVLKFLKKNDINFPINDILLCKNFCVPKQFNRNGIVWSYWFKIYHQYICCYPREILENTKWRRYYYLDELKRRHAYGTDERADQTFDVFYDFQEHSTLLKENNSAYKSLPLDHFRIGKKTRLVLWTKFIIQFLKLKTWKRNGNFIQE